MSRRTLGYGGRRLARQPACDTSHKKKREEDQGRDCEDVVGFLPRAKLPKLIDRHRAKPLLLGAVTMSNKDLGEKFPRCGGMIAHYGDYNGSDEG